MRLHFYANRLGRTGARQLRAVSSINEQSPSGIAAILHQNTMSLKGMRLEAISKKDFGSILQGRTRIAAGAEF